MRPTLLALLVLAAPLAGCAQPDPAPSPDIVATFYPVAYLADRLAGPDLTVATMVPAGVEPHDWEPTASDVADLRDAKAVLRQGAGFEPWLDPLLANAGATAVVVDTTANLTLATLDGEVDPHTWLDPVLYAQQALAVQEALAARFPEHAGAIRERGAALSAELGQLHLDYAEGLAECETRIVIANHDAYGYMARRHNLTIEALSGLSPEAEPDSQTLARAVEIAREHNITIIFFEELVSPRVAEVVAEEVGAQTRVLSPVEGVGKEGDTYVTLMRENLVGLREAMRCA